MEKIDQIAIANILKILHDRGIKAKDLAMKAGLAPQSVSRLLNGHSPPSRASIKAIADALGVTVEMLYDMPAETPESAPTAREIMKMLEAFVRAPPLARLVAFAILTDNPALVRDLPAEAALAVSVLSKAL
jgi:transcriptional regulator with XRE-family HTH domain